MQCPEGYVDNSANQTGAGEICIPELFSYNSSTQAASYLTYDISINGEGVDSEDWVAAFNGDICIGARKWNTEECNNGICDIPVNGYDGSSGTLGYISFNQIPTFQIYDSSESQYYTALVEGEITNLLNGALGGAFYPNSYYTIETLYTDGAVCPDGYIWNSGIDVDSQQCTPSQFLYNSSTQQAAYFFLEVFDFL